MRYPPEKRQQAVDLAEELDDPMEAARRCGIDPPRLIYRWCDRADKARRWREDEEDLEALFEAAGPRPQTRGDCKGGARPCPWAGCKWHLGADVGRHGAAGSWSALLNPGAPDGDITELPATCALDVIDAHPEGMTQRQAARYLGVTRRRLGQLEARALAQLPEAFREALGDEVIDAVLHNPGDHRYGYADDDEIDWFGDGGEDG